MKNKIKPILFGTPMVQAILEDRKNQTRRLIKPQPELKENSGYNTKGAAYGVGTSKKETDHNFISCVSKIQKGDILWVRETFADLKNGHNEQYYTYKGDGYYEKPDWNWKPSIFMPKAACRIFLEVTNVRVERLQDIYEDDAINEGIDIIEQDEAYRDYDGGGWGCYATAKGSFFSLWNSINGKDSWKENPWVWVYDFKRVVKPKNFLNTNSEAVSNLNSI